MSRLARSFFFLGFELGGQGFGFSRFESAVGEHQAFFVAFEDNVGAVFLVLHICVNMRQQFFAGGIDKAPEFVSSDCGNAVFKVIASR